MSRGQAETDEDNRRGSSVVHPLSTSRDADERGQLQVLVRQDHDLDTTPTELTVVLERRRLDARDPPPALLDPEPLERSVPTAAEPFLGLCH